MKDMTPLSAQMPGHEHAAATRERLLDAAEKLFGERGFLATSVREITAQARCNIAAVNYHFGSKDNLYREMFRRRLATVREKRLQLLRRNAEGDATPEAALRSIVTAFLEPLLSDELGRFMELLARELLDRRLPAEIFVDEVVEPTTAAFIQVLRKACPGLDAAAARLCIESVVAQVVYAIRMRQLGAHGGPRREPPSIEALVEHTVKFSLGGVLVVAEAGAAPVASGEAR